VQANTRLSQWQNSFTFIRSEAPSFMVSDSAATIPPKAYAKLLEWYYA
jgi:hypothetical protein